MAQLHRVTPDHGPLRRGVRAASKVFAKLSPAEQVPLLAIEVFALVGQGKPVETASQRKALRTLRFSEGIPLLLYKELPR